MAALTTKNSDHDLLVRLDTKLDLVSIQFNEVRTQMVGKADHALVDARIGKVETKLDFVLRNMYMFGGALLAVELVLKYLLK